MCEKNAVRKLEGSVAGMAILLSGALPLSAFAVAYLSISIYPFISLSISCLLWHKTKSLQLSATDISAQATMKGAAKCDKHCELQISVSQ